MNVVDDQIAEIDRLTLPAVREDDLGDTPDVLWRITFAGSPHHVPWNGLRTFGPVPGNRFDPQPPPPAVHPDSGVSYAASSLETALLEIFHVRRRIDRHTLDPVVHEFSMPGLRLLDLRSGWPSRLGLFQTVNQPTYPASQRLAHRIRATHPDLPGLLYPSVRHGRGVNAVLWTPAAPALQRTRLIDAAPLGDPRWDKVIAVVANRHGLN